MSIDKSYYINKKSNRNRWIYYLLLGIILFLTLYFPIFNPHLRYQTSEFLSEILFLIGYFFVPLGTILLLIGFATLLFKKSLRSLGIISIGFILLYFGSWCTGGSFGLPFFQDEVTGGYH